MAGGVLLPPDPMAKLPPLPTLESGPRNTDADEPDDQSEFDSERQEDGSYLVRSKNDKNNAPADAEFYQNLIDVFEGSLVNQTALDQVEKIKRDIEARQERDKQQEDGLRRTGLGKDAPGGASFPGATRVVHPGLTKAAIDFASRTIKELYPPSGPVKMKIEGKATREKMDRADRKTRHMNWQLKYEIKEYRSELETTMTQVPIGGSQYMKAWWSPSDRRARVEFLPIDRVHLPYSATGFYGAERQTLELRLTEQEFKDRIRNKMYVDPDIVTGEDRPITRSTTEPENTESENANEKIEGKKPTGYNDDGIRIVYEEYVKLVVDEDDRVEDEGRAVPYILSIDEHTGKMVSWRRNWEEENPNDNYEQMDWVVEFPMIPWRGAYAIGLPHIIGSLSAASTGGLRALLDSAHINNTAALLKLKGAKIGGQTQSVDPTGVTEIDGGVGVTDIRQIAMPMPFNPPSTVLFQLLGYLDEQTNGAVRTSLDASAVDTATNVPVGTQLSRVEQGLMVFSSIFSRLHTAQEQFLRILHRINKMYMPDKVRIGSSETFALREDYQSDMDVGPVSDPNIFSEAQRFAQLQAVDQINALHPGKINEDKLIERQLKTLKLPDYEELLLKPEEPEQTNPILENMKMSMGKAASAFPDQDHLAHLQVHLSFAQNPILGSNIIIAPVFMPLFIEHVKQHIVMWYVATTVELVQENAGVPMEELMDPDDSLRKPFDQMLAAASTHIDQFAMQELKGVPAVIQKCVQLLQQLQPKPPMDPNAQVMASEVERKKQKDIADQQDRQQQTQLRAEETRLRQQKDQTDAMNNQAELEQRTAVERQRSMTDLTRQGMADDVRVSTNTQDNLTALHIAEMDNEEGHRSEVSTGTGINP